MFHFTDPGRDPGRTRPGRADRAGHPRTGADGDQRGHSDRTRGDYFGSTVNIAARIADYAQPHEVLVSEDARRVAHADGVEFELIGDVPLKGVSQSVRLHRVLRH